jgi:hypothetical protein
MQFSLYGWEKGMQATSAERNLAEVRRSAVMERKGVNVAFLSYCAAYYTEAPLAQIRWGLHPSALSV